MSSKFNINDYLDKKVAVHCDTEEKARIFRTCLAQHGLSWCWGYHIYQDQIGVNIKSILVIIFMTVATLIRIGIENGTILY